ncbi:MAG: outer membrane beta-barrel protein [Bacteroidota bacterium]|nr:outer membrane beta-barrel protein [Bacteroidota bacterium]
MKNISLITITFLLFQAGFCAAQTAADTLPQKTYRNGKVQLGVFFSRDYCDQKYKPVVYEFDGRGVTRRQQMADRLDSNTASGLGYSLGADIICEFNERLSLKTGIYFSLKVKQYNGFIYYNGVDGTSGVFHLQNYEKEKVSYLELPVALNYLITKNASRKFRVSGFAGALFAVNCGTSTIETRRFWVRPGPLPTTADGFLVGKRKPFATAYVGVIVGVKADYRFTDHFAFSVSPVFKYLPVTWSVARGRASGIQTREVLYSAGLAFGVTYYFN